MSFSQKSIITKCKRLNYYPTTRLLGKKKKKRRRANNWVQKIGKQSETSVVLGRGTPLPSHPLPPPFPQLTKLLIYLMSNMTLSLTLSPVMNFCLLHHMICKCKVTSHSVPAFKRHIVVSVVNRLSETNV